MVQGVQGVQGIQGVQKNKGLPILSIDRPFLIDRSRPVSEWFKHQ